MLTLYRPQFIERNFTDRTGRQFRMKFVVSMVDGELKGRLISVEPIRKSLELESADSPRATAPSFASFDGASQQDILFLPISNTQKATVIEYIPAYAPVVSPYAELFFFTSQPTRAPSK